MIYNEGVAKMFGYQLSDIPDLASWWQQNIHPDDLQRVKDLISNAFQTNTETIQMEYRFRCHTGAYKFIYDRVFMLFDEKGQPIRMIGAMQDITYQKEEEQRISKEIINAQEEERQHIGSELHDNVNQILVATLISLEMAKNKLDDKAQALSFIEYTKKQIDYAIVESRKLSHELAFDIFDNTTLQQHVENLLASININHQFIINFHFESKESLLIDSAIQKNLYRILQEQVKNILKYAKATQLEISILIDRKEVVMRIYDNGKGFDPDTIRAKAGIGLRNIKRRAEIFDGKFELNSAPGEGCEVIVHIPVQNGD